MTVIYIILGIVLTVLFFLNIKNAADILCRIVGGMGILIVYNTVMTSSTQVGINLVSAIIVGLLGLPGGLLLLCLTVFL